MKKNFLFCQFIASYSWLRNALGWRGFIGPIGDDLPSLIPIIFALIIFFSTFTTTFQVFDRGNARFDRTIKILKISNALRGDKYINNRAEFVDLCKRVGVRGVNFKAGLVDLKQQAGKPFEQIDLLKFVNDDKGIYEVNGKKLVCSRGKSKMRPDSEAIVKMFPIAYQDTVTISSGFAVRPMLLVVVVWF